MIEVELPDTVKRLEYPATPKRIDHKKVDSEMKYQISLQKPRLLFFLSLGSLILSGFIWLSFPIKKQEVEDILSGRLSGELEPSIAKVDCYLQAVGSELRYQLVCNYATSTDHVLGIRNIDFENEVNAPVYAMSPGQIHEIYFERLPTPTLKFFLDSSDGMNSRITRSSMYWLGAIATQISARQPR